MRIVVPSECTTATGGEVLFASEFIQSNCSVFVFVYPYYSNCYSSSTLLETMSPRNTQIERLQEAMKVGSQKDPVNTHRQYDWNSANFAESGYLANTSRSLGSTTKKVEGAQSLNANDVGITYQSVGRKEKPFTALQPELRQLCRELVTEAMVFSVLLLLLMVCISQEIVTSITALDFLTFAVLNAHLVSPQFFAINLLFP